MTRGLGGSLLPYRVRDFHSLFLASFPGARPDPRFIHHRNGISEFQTSPRMSKLVANMPPNRVRYPTDHHFASGCSPPRLMATQLPSSTWLWFTMARISTVLVKRLPRRTHSAERRNPAKFQMVAFPGFRVSARNDSEKALLSLVEEYGSWEA